MTTIPLSDAQANLEALVHGLKPGEELVITENDQPLARLVAEGKSARRGRQPGSAIGKLTIISEDDEHLDDFREYME